MPTPASVGKQNESRLIAAGLDESLSDLEAVLLFGSVARGDAQPSSDVDLMIITSHPARKRELTPTLPSCVSPVFHTWTSFEQARQADWSFFVHLREEADPLRSTGRLQRELGLTAKPSDDVIRASLEDDLAYLERFDDLDRFGDRFHFPLARIFTLAKRACMQDNTANGFVVFNRRRAFEVYAERYPSLEPDVSLIEDLWPFLAQTQGRRPALPVEYDNPEGLRRAATSARRVIRAAIGD